MTPSLRLFTTALLLALGVQFWIILGDATLGEKRQLAACAAAAIAALILCTLPATRPAAFALLDRVRRPSPLLRRSIAIALPLLAGAYLLATARAQHRPLTPIIHDEYAYHLQARQLAAGRLWMPRHELADHFESFHLITDRVYAAKYGPGTALLAAPAIWLGQQPWVAILALSALCVGLIYLVVTDLIDGLAGLCAALALPTLLMFRRTSVDVLSQIPMLFLSLVALWAYLHFRRAVRNHAGLGAEGDDPDSPRPSPRPLPWLALMSLAVGWAAVTRPVDAVALALPLGLAVLLDLRHLARPAAVRAVAVGLACVAPFLALQAVVNKGLTGKFSTLPWSHYAHQNDPFDTLGRVPPGTPARTLSQLPQKQQFLEEFTLVNYNYKANSRFLKRLIEDRLAQTAILNVPHSLLLVLLPLGLLGVWRNRRWVAAGFLVTFLALYTQYSFFIAHYTVPAAAALLVLVLAGYDALAAGLPRAARQPARLIAGLAILALTVTSLPQFLREPPDDEWDNAPLVRAIDRHLATTIGDQPAIVLFRYDPGANPHVEPVYNATVAWPDDARVIRAHDLGPDRNRALFAYYARVAPDRRVYRYDRAPAAADHPLTDLGTARDLAAPPAGAAR